MELEKQINDLLDGADLRRAATRTIQGYGPEVLGFLFALLGNPDDAEEVFSQASEDLWAGIEGFKRRSSMRTWFYTLARNSASRFRRSPHHRPGRHAPISQVSDLVAAVRTTTAPHLRTDVKDRFATIREALEPDDRTLLVLRVDRGMSWNEIASVMAGEEDEGSAQTITRVAARLRKRFQLVKDEIRRRAKEMGLLPD